ncbi:hypothetical protein VTJ04DRAFT_7516 [Mycothermus thermophilus]|uniref:uncharacterized protein n=1 Tax=Humicola insolens TaxID=85995 RepID=UPI00374256D5
MTASSVPPSLSRLVGREELLEVLVLVIVAAFLSAFIVSQLILDEPHGNAAIGGRLCRSCIFVSFSCPSREPRNRPEHALRSRSKMNTGKGARA